MLLSVAMTVVLAAAPTRVTDDNGCNKGIDANNELDGEIVCTRGGEKQYEGAYAHGKRVGVAKTWTRGKLRSVDHFVDGKKSGLCEEYNPDGVIEESCQYKDDKKDGPCKLFGREGKLREERVYVGGEQRGPFTSYHPNGKVQERGTLDENGKRHGLFERFRDDGKPDEAIAYVHGQREGPMREWHSNGQLRRESNWKADREHGLSKSFHENGQLQETDCYQSGEHVLGLGPCTGKSGPEVATRFFPDGKPRETTSVRDGKRNGEHQVFDKNAQLLMSESLINDQPDGLQKRFKDGKLERQVTWKANKKSGPETTYFDDGKVLEETVWKDDRRQSTTTWWMNGKKKRAEVLDGELWKVAEWYDNGQQQSEETVTDQGYRGRNEGVSRRWSEEGTLVEETHWKAGKRHGLSKSWFDKTGKPSSEEEWADGVRLAMKSWDETGKVLKDERYNADGSRK